MLGRVKEAAMAQASPVAPPLRVVLVDDHAVVRSGLKAELETRRIEIVAEADDVASAVTAIGRAAPDVVVLDVRLPGGGGPAVLDRLDPVPPTLAVSASDERGDVVATVSAGATGYLLKTSPIEELVAAVRATAEGQPVFSPELAGHLLDLDLADHVTDETWQRLTDRQRDVLRLLARGRTYREIAEELVVAAKTVETHVRHILHTLQVSNRHEAARWAMEHGLGD
jgi:DNA-binding NarL/FixJ family response regulator